MTVQTKFQICTIFVFNIFDICQFLPKTHELTVIFFLVVCPIIRFNISFLNGSNMFQEYQ
ncbi:hypothetical protein Hanom_Chr07g00637041 [Helianthus anomalus]